MSSSRTTVRTGRTLLAASAALGLALAAALAVAASLGPGAVQAQAAPSASLQTCGWEGGGQFTQRVYFAAGAYDTDNDVLYTIGGVNERNDILDRTQTMAYGSAMAPGDGSGGSARNMPKERFGAAAFYRPNPRAGEDGYIYVITGSEDLGLDDENGGRGEDDGYVLDIGADTWAPISFRGAAIGERVYAAAAHDPSTDVAVIVGGTRQCAQETIDLGGQCSADSLGTVFLEFDPMDPTDVTVSTKAASSPMLYGHSLTYGNGRMYLHGGTRNGSQANTTTMELDTSAPATADWSSVAGNGPRVAFHSAAYDEANGWLVVHGGASGRFFDPSESVNTDTDGFTATAATPAWVDLNARATPAERIGATAGYVDNGAFTGMVMASGRRKYQNRDQQNAENKAEVLSCGAAPTPSPTAQPTTPAPPTTPPPGGTGTPTPVTPMPTAAPNAKECPRLRGVAPDAVIANALSNPGSVAGWGELCNPNILPGLWNVQRTYLSLQNISVPFHPIYNNVVFKCGCP